MMRSLKHRRPHPNHNNRRQGIAFLAVFARSGAFPGRFQLANFLRNSCSSSLYLKALRPSMKTTGTSSVNWRLRLSSVSTSTSRQRKPPRRSSFLSFSFTISQRWHPLREYTITSRSRDMGGSLASRMGFFHSYLFVSGQFFDCTEPDWDARYNPFHGGTGFQTAGRKGCSGNRRG